MSLVSSALAGGFFTTSNPWKAPVHDGVKLQSGWRYPCLDIQGIYLHCSQSKHSPRDFRKNVSKSRIPPFSLWKKRTETPFIMVSEWCWSWHNLAISRNHLGCWPHRGLCSGLPARETSHSLGQTPGTARVTQLSALSASWGGHPGW